ncbi:NAD(P)H-hydrate epimerase [Halonotius terrestris]|uniref:NAD(P)H-hydrate epimerase n=1 Tax=Halonotius terrestris TaxID=2487750 RepID=A0A8J8PDA6_9EURY|nr:NAD(P)H-hydrate epimerase [Halonotius terrestris]TQQ82928.1 NAD(P)H-hydrate epimerase [Halonotius terrestris]
MDAAAFRTAHGEPVPAVTAAEMAEVDRVAVEEFGLGIIQMMEHAGRTLSRTALESDANQMVVVAGGGGNGGGGLACARHLAARDRLHSIVLDRSPDEYEGAPATQLRLLERMGVEIIDADAAPEPAATAISDADRIIDALIGYGLTGAPRGTAGDLITEMQSAAAPALSLDVPSGVDATTGETAGVAVEPEQTLTLALPKTGLTATAGSLRCADLGILAGVYEAADIDYDHPFGDQFCVDLTVTE